MLSVDRPPCLVLLSSGLWFVLLGARENAVLSAHTIVELRRALSPNRFEQIDHRLPQALVDFFVEYGAAVGLALDLLVHGVHPFNRWPAPSSDSTGLRA